MTDLLKDVMSDRAEAASDLPVDLDGVIRAGDRRIRRRRVLHGIGAAALATSVAAGGITALRAHSPGPARSDDPAPAAITLPQRPGPPVPLRFYADKPTWVDGRFIHYGDQRFEGPAGGVGVLVKTDAGFVYTNELEGLVLTDGRKPVVLSRTADFNLAAAESGTLVAWTEQNSGVTELVVYDTQRHYQLIRSTTAGDSSADGSHQRAVVNLLGMDRGVVYITVGNGAIVRRDLRTGETRAVPGDPLTWKDTAAGKFVHERKRGSDAVVIGTDLSSVVMGGAAPALPATRADLSPTARLLATDYDDVTTVYDVVSRTPRALDHPSHPVISPAQWVSDDQLVVVGFRTRQPKLADLIDLLSCSVSSGRCTILARDAARYANAIHYFDETVPDQWSLAFPTGTREHY